jgi:hypothetical protein
MKGELGSSEASVLTQPHGVTSQKTPLFKELDVGSCTIDDESVSSWLLQHGRTGLLLKVSKKGYEFDAR